jgi:hypothetical protein
VYIDGLHGGCFNFSFCGEEILSSVGKVEDLLQALFCTWAGAALIENHEHKLK